MNSLMVDPRTGSKELFAELSRKIPCTMDAQLPGDFVFEGFTPNGRGFVGIERKTVSDALDCMVNGRFSGHQLPELADVCEVMYFIVEGLWRPQQGTGLMEVWLRGGWTASRKGSRTFMYKDFDNFLTTLMNLTPVKVLRSSSITETVQIIADKFEWHNDKPWNKHTSHLQIHNTNKPGQRTSFRKPSLRRVISCDLPGISWHRSLDTEARFKTTHEMINASVEEWQTVPGIGKGIAEKVHAALRRD